MRFLLAALAVATFAFSASAQSKSTKEAIRGSGSYGAAGCGLGALVFGNQRGIVQVLAVTTNGTSASQTFGITSGTSNCGPGVYAEGTKDFVEANREVVAKDISRGSGEAIGALAVINGCRALRGVGASQGAWDEGRGEVDDALAVIAAMRRAGEPLLLAGFSFGAYVASQAAARLPDDAKPRRLVLVGPSTQRQQMPAVPADTVVIHGEADEVVPLAATLDWARPQALPVVVVPGVGHFFHGQLPLLRSIVVGAWQR